jgi:hypothetical protein
MFYILYCISFTSRIAYIYLFKINQLVWIIIDLFLLVLSESVKRRTVVRGARKRRSAVKFGNTWRSIWMKTIWSRGPKPKGDGATARDRSSPRPLPWSTGESPSADGWNTRTQGITKYVVSICYSCILINISYKKTIIIQILNISLITLTSSTIFLNKFIGY